MARSGNRQVQPCCSESNWCPAKGEVNFAYDNLNRLSFLPPASQWTHVALDVNGALFVKQPASGAIGDAVPSMNDFRIGGRQDTGQHFSGRIDEVRIYNRALAAAEVASLAKPPVVYVCGLDLISQTRSGATSYYGYDGHGSVRFLVNARGTVTDTYTYTYDAFGNLLSSTGTTINNYRYTGEQWDPDLGMYYLRARYYHPDLGRFWTMDTFEGNQTDPVSLHPYLYCADDTVNNSDPSGHMSIGSFMITMGTWGFMAANLGIRALPMLNRATVVLFEAATGNSVFLGGKGAVVALSRGTEEQSTEALAGKSGRVLETR